MGETNVAELSYRFALRIVKLDEYLQSKRHFSLANQILRSGTSIGALVAEAQYAQSKADFVNKLHIALKEASETRHWLRLLHDSRYPETKIYTSMLSDVESLIRILTKSINTTKATLK